MSCCSESCSWAPQRSSPSKQSRREPTSIRQSKVNGGIDSGSCVTLQRPLLWTAILYSFLLNLLISQLFLFSVGGDVSAVCGAFCVDCLLSSEGAWFGLLSPVRLL